VSAYCSDAQANRFLPSSHGLTLAAYKTEAAALLDARLSPRYWTPFPDVTATPATPVELQTPAAMLTAWLAWLTLGATNRFSDVSPCQFMFEQAERLLAAIMDPDPTTPQLSLVQVTDEAMTFGTDPLDDDEYKLAASPKTVIPASVTIAGYEYGVDFVVGYKVENRGWVLTRLTAEIVDGHKVSYQYSYLKQVEIDLPPTYAGGRIVRG